MALANRKMTTSLFLQVNISYKNLYYFNLNLLTKCEEARKECHLTDVQEACATKKIG